MAHRPHELIERTWELLAEFRPVPEYPRLRRPTRPVPRDALLHVSEEADEWFEALIAEPALMTLRWGHASEIHQHLYAAGAWEHPCLYLEWSYRYPGRTRQILAAVTEWEPA